MQTENQLEAGYDNQQGTWQAIVNKCYRGGKFLPALLLLLAFLAFSACNEDTPVIPDSENLIETPAADSTAVGDSIFVDPAWADTIDYNFDNDAELNITIPDGTPEEGDAGGAV